MYFLKDFEFVQFEQLQWTEAAHSVSNMISQPQIKRVWIKSRQTEEILMLSDRQITLHLFYERCVISNELEITKICFTASCHCFPCKQASLDTKSPDLVFNLLPSTALIRFVSCSGDELIKFYDQRRLRQVIIHLVSLCVCPGDDFCSGNRHRSRFEYFESVCRHNKTSIDWWLISSHLFCCWDQN